MRNSLRSSALLWLISVMVCQFTAATAQDVRRLSPVSRSYAIIGVTAIPAPGKKLENATVLVKDGRIAGIGQNLVVPADATVVRGDSLFVYAGFIDGLSRVAINKPNDEKPKERQKDPGNPDPVAAGITPYIDLRGELSATEKSIEEWRALGFTMGQIVPYGGMLPGRAALIYYNGEDADKMMINPQAGMYSEFTPAERMYPATILGVLAKWKELYRQASYAKSYSAVYAANKAGLEIPATDRVLEAFYPVIDKRIPVVFRTENNLDIYRALDLKKQLGFNMVLTEVKEGWSAIPALKAIGGVFLSLDLPEETKPGDKKDPSKYDAATWPDSLEYNAVRKRRDDTLAKYVAQASEYQKAGVSFGFSTLSAKPKDTKTNLSRMIKSGLTEDAALAALTVNAAAALGVSDRLGTIETGKIANLVISRRPYFDKKSKVVYVFIAGKQYIVRSSENTAEPTKKP